MCQHASPSPQSRPLGEEVVSKSGPPEPLNGVGVGGGGKGSLGVEMQTDNYWGGLNSLPNSVSSEGLSLGTQPAVGCGRSY